MCLCIYQYSITLSKFELSGVSSRDTVAPCCSRDMLKETVSCCDTWMLNIDALARRLKRLPVEPQPRVGSHPEWPRTMSGWTVCSCSFAPWAHTSKQGSQDSVWPSAKEPLTCCCVLSEKAVPEDKLLVLCPVPCAPKHPLMTITCCRTCGMLWAAIIACLFWCCARS